MFGIIYTGIVGICKAVVGIQDTIEDDRLYNEAKAKGRLTYRDHKGLERYMKTGEVVWHNTLRNGDRVLETTDGRVVYNIDAQWKQEMLKEKQKKLAQETDKFILLGNMQTVFPERVRASGTIWQNIYGKEAVYKYIPNGKYYLRKMCYGSQKYYPRYIYIDLETGRVTALDQDTTDYWKEQEKLKNKGWDEGYTKSINTKGVDFCI